MNRILDIKGLGCLSFRKGTLDDLETVIDIDESLFPDGQSYDAETFFFYLMDHQTDVIIVELENKIVGFLIFRPQSHIAGCVVSIDVVKEFQSKGIGSALLEVAESLSLKMSHATMILQTPVDNSHTIHFYEKRSYKKTRRIHGYYQDGTGAWEMEKCLLKVE
ncbi:hypothetical protein MNBD_NITROSPINAE01-1729 [hydrothermal vent metagenome]|uniref:N-acetyltransferase domain-containing protein n=1 Tax=hydrothermal vent metagenome TaxID=652676 RepID=A0A3B1C3T2_9ZZZZ